MRKAFLLLGVCPNKLAGPVDYSNPNTFEVLLPSDKCRISLYFPEDASEPVEEAIKKSKAVNELHEVVLSLPLAALEPEQIIKHAVTATMKDGVDVIAIINGCYIGTSASVHTIKPALPLMESTVMQISAILGEMPVENIITSMYSATATA